MGGVVSILEYHGVHGAPRGLMQPFLYIHPAKLRRQMAVLRLLGIRGLSVTEALRHVDEARAGRVVALTFDDAYQDVFENALPILRSTGFSATCYAVSAHVGDYNSWDAEKLGVRKPLMTHPQLLAWREAGMEVGAHTRTHPRLTECSDAQIEDEIHGSKLALESMVGEGVTQFCYPYGDVDGRVAAAVRAAGFTAAVTTRRGRAHGSDDRFLLPRVPIRGDRALAAFPFRTLTRYADRRR